MKVYPITNSNVRFGNTHKQNRQNVTISDQNSNHEQGRSNSLRKGVFLPAALVLGMLVPTMNSCEEDVTAIANAYASSSAYASASANATAIAKVGGCGCHKGDADTIYVPTRDSIYIHDTIPGDTVYVPKHDTINNWNRPTLLDSLNNQKIIGDIPGAPSGNKRNIAEYDVTREWEYNNREVGKIDLGYSSKDILLYRTSIYDYKGNEISDGYRVFSTPKGDFTVEYKNGKVAHSPKGFFMTEVDRAENTQKQYFCWTDGDTIRVAPFVDGKFVEQFGTGGVAKGENGDDTILLRNLIGNEPTKDHLVNVKLVAKTDDELVQEYSEGSY